jgi:hypothetical protein
MLCWALEPIPRMNWRRSLLAVRRSQNRKSTRGDEPGARDVALNTSTMQFFAHGALDVATDLVRETNRIVQRPAPDNHLIHCSRRTPRSMKTINTNENGVHVESNKPDTAVLTVRIRARNEDGALGPTFRSRVTADKLSVHLYTRTPADQEPGLEAHAAWLAKEKKARDDKLAADLAQIPIAKRVDLP